MGMDEKKPKVSVCVVTYNQEKYIRQCLQSIVDQETDFDFEVFVGEDCSTDGTRAIVQEFADKYPDIVKPIFHDKNIGVTKNYLSVHSLATGRYIAHMDGDDYSLPGKLQTQANILDENPKCNIVWHRMQIETKDRCIKDGPLLNFLNIENIKFDRGLIIQNISIGFNSSKMYRSTSKYFDLPNFELVDYFANVEQVNDGFARFTDSRYYGVYRTGIGISSNGIMTRQILAKCFIYFYNKYPEYKLQTNTAVLMYLVADLKNKRKTWLMFFVVWVRTFHIGSILNLIKNLNFIKKLRINK